VVISLAACFLAVGMAGVKAEQAGQARNGVPVKSNEIGGLVASSKGPEAGVWVITETSGLPTNFIKIVVTDDQGRYLLPELPAATYKVWVRGYGLVDSKAVEGTPGKAVGYTRPTLQT